MTEPGVKNAQATMQFLLRLRERGVNNVAVLRALETLPREIFVPHRHADLAWRDIALPIACGQTMPEPYIVARMMEALKLAPEHRVLEIGTGNGYSAAILGKLAREVVSYERFEALAIAAEKRLQTLGLSNVRVVCADGMSVDESAGLFDRILIHGALDDVPETFVNLLTEGGIVVFGETTEGRGVARLTRLSHGANGFQRDVIATCRMQPIIH